MNVKFHIIIIIIMGGGTQQEKILLLGKKTTTREERPTEKNKAVFHKLQCKRQRQRS